MNIPLNIDFLQILLHLFNFVLLAGGLTFLLYKPVNNFLEKRKEHFAELEKKNKESLEENERLRAEYEHKLKTADTEIEEMKKSAEKEYSEISTRHINEAKQKASAIILAAEQEAEDRKAHIMESAQTEIGELVVLAAQKLLSDTVTPERNSALYDEFIRLADDADEAAAAERAEND
ncbi:MAG: ATP synthase F0 subunit B [Christensenellaceae bacterium]|nr:ATP synthase F0 subunit B [Christensenellaceae bacterium]